MWLEVREHYRDKNKSEREQESEREEKEMRAEGIKGKKI